MRIKRYFTEVFVEPDSYGTVRELKSGDELELKKNGASVDVFLEGKNIGVVRGKKRALVGAIFEYERATKALFYNMNEKEGVMLVKVMIDDEPYK